MCDYTEYPVRYRACKLESKHTGIKTNYFYCSSSVGVDAGSAWKGQECPETPEAPGTARIDGSLHSMQ